VKNVLEQWGPEFASAEAQPLKEGVWQLELGAQTYILKRRSNRTRVWEEYNLLQWLHKHGQPISQLVCTSADVPWAEYHGFFYVLYPYLAGTPGDDLDLFEQTLARQAGSALARLHQALAAYEASCEFPDFNLFQKVSSYAWPNVQSYSTVKFSNRLEDLRHAISAHLVNPYEALPRQLIHRDFHPGNLLFTDGELSGILDFDRVRIGVRLFDLCYLSTAVLSSCFNDPRQREEWPSFVRELIKGYVTVQALEKTEAYVFLYLIYLIQLLFTAYYLDEGNTKLADLNLAILFWINDQHDYLEPLIEKAAMGSGGAVV